MALFVGQNPVGVLCRIEESAACRIVLGIVPVTFQPVLHVGQARHRVVRDAASADVHLATDWKANSASPWGGLVLHWIDANNFQVVRLETDLREPYPEVRLLAEHLVLEYGPVQFKTRNEQLWLPSSADYYRISSNRRIHRRHSFTDYVLFSVEDRQQIGEPPKDKTTPGLPPESNSSE